MNVQVQSINKYNKPLLYSYCEELKAQKQNIMNKKLKPLLVCIWLLSSTFIYGIPGFSGSGTLADPYQISTAADLATLATNVNGGNTYNGSYFKLMNDLSLSSYTNWDPIGNDTSVYFKGVFNGNNKIITGLTITGNSYYRGLFGNVAAGCEIKDLTIEGCSITGWEFVGALVGQVTLDTANIAVKITNCKSSGTLSSASSTGGLIGYLKFTNGGGNDNYSVIITNCSSSVNVSCSEEGALGGGLIGYMEGSNASSMPIVSNCYAMGSVTGNDYSWLGGLIGYAANSKILNCYARGNVSAGADAWAGGFAGFVQSSTVTNCYSTGGSNIFGFIGNYEAGSTISSYWDTQTSGQLTCSSPAV